MHLSIYPTVALFLGFFAWNTDFEPRKNESVKRKGSYNGGYTALRHNRTEGVYADIGGYNSSRKKPAHINQS